MRVIVQDVALRRTEGHWTHHIIHELPTIDAEPVRHGRWEWYEYWGDAAFRDPPEIYDAGWACSACGTALLQYLHSHFPDIPSYTECASEEKPTLERCPCCGAKMDAKEDNHAAKETNDLAG